MTYLEYVKIISPIVLSTLCPNAKAMVEPGPIWITYGSRIEPYR
jgi:hypothetical protein